MKYTILGQEIYFKAAKIAEYVSSRQNIILSMYDGRSHGGKYIIFTDGTFIWSGRTNINYNVRSYWRLSPTSNTIEYSSDKDFRRNLYVYPFTDLLMRDYSNYLIEKELLGDGSL